MNMAAQAEDDALKWWGSFFGEISLWNFNAFFFTPTNHNRLSKRWRDSSQDAWESQIVFNLLIQVNHGTWKFHLVSVELKSADLKPMGNGCVTDLIKFFLKLNIHDWHIFFF